MVEEEEGGGGRREEEEEDNLSSGFLFKVAHRKSTGNGRGCAELLSQATIAFRTRQVPNKIALDIHSAHQRVPFTAAVVRYDLGTLVWIVADRTRGIDPLQDSKPRATRPLLRDALLDQTARHKGAIAGDEQVNHRLRVAEGGFLLVHGELPAAVGALATRLVVDVPLSLFPCPSQALVPYRRAAVGRKRLKDAPQRQPRAAWQCS